MPKTIEAKDAYFACVIFSGFVDLYHPLFERARGQGLYSASLFPHAIRPLEVPPPPCTRNVRNVHHFLGDRRWAPHCTATQRHVTWGCPRFEERPFSRAPHGTCAGSQWMERRSTRSVSTEKSRSRPSSKPQHLTPLPFLPLTTRHLRVQCNDPKQAVIPGAGLRLSRAPEAVRATQPQPCLARVYCKCFSP